MIFVAYLKSLIPLYSCSFSCKSQEYMWTKHVNFNSALYKMLDFMLPPSGHYKDVRNSFWIWWEIWPYLLASQYIKTKYFSAFISFIKKNNPLTLNRFTAPDNGHKKLTYVPLPIHYFSILNLKTKHIKYSPCNSTAFTVPSSHKKSLDNFKLKDLRKIKTDHKKNKSNFSPSPWVMKTTGHFHC